jgi:hypothetical protein
MSDEVHNILQISNGVIALFFLLFILRAEYIRRRSGVVLLDLGRPAINKWRRSILYVIFILLCALTVFDFSLHGFEHGFAPYYFYPFFIFIGYIQFRRGEARTAGVNFPSDPTLTPWNTITSYHWVGDGFQLALNSPKTLFSFLRPNTKTWLCREENKAEVEGILAEHTKH